MKSTTRTAVAWLRRAAALVTLIAFTALFLGLAGSFAKWLCVLAGWEFAPALLAGNVIVAGGILLMTLLVGRLYCGVCCPLGIIQDVAWRLVPHKRRKGVRAKGKAGTAQTVIRFTILLAALAVGLCGLGYSWLEPYGIFGRGVAAAQLNAPAWAIAAQLGLLAIIFALAVWRGRVWCNWVCPVGTLLGSVSAAAPLALKIDPKKCIGCRKCERRCRAGAIAIGGKGEGGKIDRTKCVQCRDCTILCPAEAISEKTPVKTTPHKPAADVHAPDAPKQSSATMTRREFIIGSSAAGAALAANAADEKIFDGGFAEISEPGIDKRNAPLKPAGSHSLKNFREKCVACQLCVQMCPNHVLRPSMHLNDFMQPEMAFDKGFCTPDCTRCSQVCPAGAITPITPEQKLYTHIGEAVWHKDRCLAATEGVNCTACFRHCPTRAISRVKNDDGVLIPVVDTFVCMGCGACEHVCPARPLPGMTVKAFERHREHAKMDETDALREAISLVEKDGKSCVLIKDGIFTAIKEGRGVAPLLDILDHDSSALKGAFLVDKVIGRAAAAICVATGVRGVYGLTVSAEGAAFLAEHNIPCEAKNTVPKILNRDKTDLCPLEKSCLGLTKPDEMVAAIRATIARMK